MLHHIFSQRSQSGKKIFKLKTLKSFTSYSQWLFYINSECTSFLRDFCSGDSLWKKTTIKAKILDDGGDVKGIFKACLTSLKLQN